MIPLMVKESILRIDIEPLHMVSEERYIFQYTETKWRVI